MTNELRKYYSDEMAKGTLKEAQVTKIVGVINKHMGYEKAMNNLMIKVKGGSTNGNGH